MARRRIIGARNPESLMSKEERLGWPQAAFTGIYQWVVKRVAIVNHEKGPLVVCGCQCPVLGLNGKRREASWSAWLKRSEAGASLERRTNLDRALERIYGALPPIDFRLSDLVGVNFVARCRMEVVEDDRMEKGYRQASYIKIKTIRRYTGGKKYLMDPIIELKEPPDTQGPSGDHLPDPETTEGNGESPERS